MKHFIVNAGKQFFVAEGMITLLLSYRSRFLVLVLTQFSLAHMNFISTCALAFFELAATASFIMTGAKRLRI